MSNDHQGIVTVMCALGAWGELLLIDSTHITTQSHQNLSAQLGYNSQHQFDTHINNFFALRAYYRIFAQLKETDLGKKYFPADILLLLQNIKKIKINDQWVEAEITKKQK